MPHMVAFLSINGSGLRAFGTRTAQAPRTMITESSGLSSELLTAIPQSLHIEGINHLDIANPNTPHQLLQFHALVFFPCAEIPVPGWSWWPVMAVVPLSSMMMVIFPSL